MAGLYKRLHHSAGGDRSDRAGDRLLGVRTRAVHGGTYRTPIGTAITGAIVTYVLTLVGVYVLALIIDALAPTFNGTQNQIQALKVAAYSSTASWVAGIFALMPGLRILTILGLYSLYLLYLGLPVLMKAPAGQGAGVYGAWSLWRRSCCSCWSGSWRGEL